MSNLLTTEQWLSKAEQVRLIAGSLRDETARRIMLSVAAGYERLAEHAASLAAIAPPHGNLEPSRVTTSGGH